ncbi:MAG: PilZ domain-containing protein [Pseudomonadota bacterium]
MGAHLYDAVETAIIEQRREPRIRVDASVKLEGVPGRLRNLSASGAQIWVDELYADALRPIVNESCLCLEIALDPSIELDVQVVYAAKHEGGYLMGMKFLDPNAPDRAVIRDVIAKAG